MNGNPDFQTIQLRLNDDLATQARIGLTFCREIEQCVLLLGWGWHEPDPSFAQIYVAGGAGELTAAIGVNPCNSCRYRPFHDRDAIVDRDVRFLPRRIDKSYQNHFIFLCARFLSGRVLMLAFQYPHDLLTLFARRAKQLGVGARPLVVEVVPHFPGEADSPEHLNIAGGGSAILLAGIALCNGCGLAGVGGTLA